MEAGWSRNRPGRGGEKLERGAGDPQERKKRSAARAKREVLRKCMAGKLDHLVTCTYRRNEESLKTALEDAERFIRNVRKKIPEWEYIMTWELQEERAKRFGVSVWHLHFAVRGFQSIPVLQSAWESVVGRGQGNVDVHMPGRSRGEKFRKSARWGRLRLGRYLGKYIGKNFDAVELNKKRYWHSEGVESPPIERVPVFRGDLLGWAREIFEASGVRVVRIWEHESGLYGYISSF